MTQILRWFSTAAASALRRDRSRSSVLWEGTTVTRYLATQSDFDLANGLLIGLPISLLHRDEVVVGRGLHMPLGISGPSGQRVFTRLCAFPVVMPECPAIG